MEQRDRHLASARRAYHGSWTLEGLGADTSSFYDQYFEPELVRKGIALAWFKFSTPTTLTWRLQNGRFQWVQDSTKCLDVLPQKMSYYVTIVPCGPSPGQTGWSYDPVRGVIRNNGLWLTAVDVLAGQDRLELSPYYPAVINRLRLTWSIE